MIRGSNGDRMCTSSEAPSPAFSSASGRAQCSCLPAPSSATGTSSLRLAPDPRLVRRIEMADRIQAHDAFRAQGAVEQITGSFTRGGGLWWLIGRLVPAEMPRHQLIGLEHAVALGDREPAFVERKLQRALRRLAAGPQMLLVDQHVVVDVADRPPARA